MLDVLAVERGDERAAQLLGDAVVDFFVLLARLDEVVEVGAAAVGLHALEVVGEQLCAREPFLGAGLEEVVEFLVFAEKFLDCGNHAPEILRASRRDGNGFFVTIWLRKKRGTG